jgi:sentrin-specific protease 1
VPSIDQLRVLEITKNKEIERRLRGPTLPTALPLEDDRRVDKILEKQGIVAKCAKEQVRDVDIKRLKPGEWLNDEIINFYGAMLQASSNKTKENVQINNIADRKVKFLDLYYFSTFFWPKLVRDGYEKGRLARWTKKVLRHPH